MVHSVYSDRDIFLRELISNAADACEKLAATLARREARAAGEPPDFDNPASSAERQGTLTVSRQRRRHGPGGADRQTRHHRPLRHQSLPGGAAGDASEELGPHRAVRRRLLFAFMVATKVDVVTRRARNGRGLAWSSDGQGLVHDRAARARGSRRCAARASRAPRRWLAENYCRGPYGGAHRPRAFQRGPRARSTSSSSPSRRRRARPLTSRARRIGGWRGDLDQAQDRGERRRNTRNSIGGLPDSSTSRR